MAAPTKKLRACWTFDEPEDDNVVMTYRGSLSGPPLCNERLFEKFGEARDAVVNIDLEYEIMKAMQTEITAEIDKEIIKSLKFK